MIAFDVDRHLVNGAPAEVDHLLRMPEREAARVAGVAGVGGAGRVAARQRGRPSRSARSRR